MSDFERMKAAQAYALACAREADAFAERRVARRFDGAVARISSVAAAERMRLRLAMRHAIRAMRSAPSVV